jgi:hypothetical protein
LPINRCEERGLVGEDAPAVTGVNHNQHAGTLPSQLGKRRGKLGYSAVKYLGICGRPVLFAIGRDVRTRQLLSVGEHLKREESPRGEKLEISRRLREIAVSLARVRVVFLLHK